MKVYQVYHIFDIGNGFGYAIEVESLIATFTDKADAEAVKEKLHNPRVYDESYDQLWCGNIVIKEIKVVKHKKFDLDKYKADWNDWGFLANDED